MDRAFFTNIQTEIIKNIRTAESELIVAMAWFTNDALFNELVNLRKRGVSVRVVLLDDVINWMSYAPDFNRLIAVGADFYVAPVDMGFLHHKFCVIDGRKTITGSYNWTYYAETRNLENIIITDDINVCRQYKDVFEKIIGNMTRKDNVRKIQLNEISHLQNVNIDEINKELEIISKKRKLPSVQQIAARRPFVQIIDRKKKALSNIDIGMYVKEKRQSFKWHCFIEKGTPLPVNKVKNDVPFYLSGKPPFSMKIVYYVNKDKKHPYIILSQFLEKIADMSKSENEINIYISLNEEGGVTCEVHALSTGKSLVTTETIPNAVKYE